VDVGETDDGSALLQIPSTDVTQTVSDVVRWSERHGYTLSGLEIKRHSLEDVFLELTNHGGSS
jgi:hypothetical protein